MSGFDIARRSSQWPPKKVIVKPFIFSGETINIKQEEHESDLEQNISRPTSTQERQKEEEKKPH